MPSDIELPILIALTKYFIKSLRSLHTCSSAVQSINQQLCLFALTASIFGYQLFLSGDDSALSVTS